MSDIVVSHKKMLYFLTLEKNYNELADLFSMTQEQRENPQAASWMIDRIKQFQTSYILRKSTIEIAQHPPGEKLGLDKEE